MSAAKVKQGGRCRELRHVPDTATPPVEPPAPLRVGDRLRLAHGTDRWWWRVQAVSENFVACVHQQPFEPAGVLCYTVLDWRNGVRGPCNEIGQGWGDGTYSERECADMLTVFETVTVICPARGPQYEREVSHRNRVPLKVLDVRRNRDALLPANRREGPINAS